MEPVPQPPAEREGQEEEFDERDLEEEGPEEASENSEREDEEDEEAEGRGPAIRVGREGMPERVIGFHQLLRLFGAADRPFGMREVQSNEDLVAQLEASGNFHDARVRQALLTCPRALFLPSSHRDSAYQDAPLRLESLGFNVSAPSIHATALEALTVQPGNVVLDVGCGCGCTSAYLAFLTGTRGFVKAVDIRSGAVDLTRSGLQVLRERNPEFAALASPVEVEQADVFLPLPRSRARLYDRIHVGCACPEDRVRAILALLVPGGRAVIPVASDLRVYTRTEGSLGLTSPPATFRPGSYGAASAPQSQQQGFRYSVITQVRFTDLEVPSDVLILQTTLQNLHSDRLTDLLSAPPSTLAKDLERAALTPDEALHWFRSLTASSTPPPPAASLPSSLASTSTTLHHHTPEKDAPRNQTENAPSSSSSSSPSAPPPPPDALLVGPTWSLPCHSRILLARCPFYQSRAASGMVDEANNVISLPSDDPEVFSRETGLLVMEYLYTDRLRPAPEQKEAEGSGGQPPEEEEESDWPTLLGKVALLASYLGIDRLVKCCEGYLAAELTRVERPASFERPEKRASGGPPTTAATSAPVGVPEPATAAVPSRASPPSEPRPGTNAKRPRTKSPSEDESPEPVPAPHAATHDHFQWALSSVPSLLALAGELNLPGLKFAGLDFLSKNWSLVSGDPSALAQLSREDLLDVIEYQSAQRMLVESLIEEEASQGRKGHYPPSASSTLDVFRGILGL